MVAYLDKTGLSYLWAKIKAYVASVFAGGMQYVGTCTSAADSQNKEATVDSSFILSKGVTVLIKFSNSNTFSATAENYITLNVNNTGAKRIYYNTSNANTGTNTTAYGTKNKYSIYTYDGSQWLWVGQGNDANTTYTNMSAAEIVAGTVTTGRVISAKVLNDWLNGKEYITADSIPDVITDTEMDSVLG